MALTGRGSLSLRKQDVKEQKSIATGFKKLHFAHKAEAGDTSINLSTLTLPPEMVGFTNPAPTELLEAQLFFYRKNLTLISSSRGVLMDYLSYEVSSTKITLIGFTAEDGEIFTGIIDHNARTGIQLVDAAPLVSTGEIGVGITDYNVGQTFEINKHSSQQVGAVLVYRNGMLQARNSGNSSTILSGNYYEVNNGSGTGQIIRFNVAPVTQADAIMVVSNGLMAYNPDGGALQRIESLSGKVDSMVPTVAALAGVSEDTFGGVSNVDLKSFGDTVLELQARIKKLEIPPLIETRTNTVSTVFQNTISTVVPFPTPLDHSTGLWNNGSHRFVSDRVMNVAVNVIVQMLTGNATSLSFALNIRKNGVIQSEAVYTDIDSAYSHYPAFGDRRPLNNHRVVSLNVGDYVDITMTVFSEDGANKNLINGHAQNILSIVEIR